jgi:hypothetical protein
LLQFDASRLPDTLSLDLSVLGTFMRVYFGDKVTLEVVVLRPDEARGLPSDFLSREWGVDHLSQDGSQRIKEIVTDIFRVLG